MQKFVLHLFFLFLSLNVLSQDKSQEVIISLETGTTIKGEIINSGDSYYIVEDEGGEERRIRKSNISEINYQEKTNSSEEIERSSESEFRDDSKNFLSIGLGYGNSYGGLGTSLQYQFGAIALHAGVGYFPASMVYDYDFVDDAFLVGCGMKIFLGKDQVLYLNPQYGSFGIKAAETSYSSGGDTFTSGAQDVMHGPSMLLGIDTYFNKSLGFNAAIGISYNTVENEWDELLDQDMTYLFAIDLGIMIK